MRRSEPANQWMPNQCSRVSFSMWYFCWKISSVRNYLYETIQQKRYLEPSGSSSQGSVSSFCIVILSSSLEPLVLNVEWKNCSTPLLTVTNLIQALAEILLEKHQQPLCAYNSFSCIRYKQQIRCVLLQPFNWDTATATMPVPF